MLNMDYSEFEGKLFLNRFIATVKSDFFMLDQHYYTMKDGIIYEIHKGKLTASGDKPSDLIKCIEIGMFDENNLPKHIDPIDFNYDKLVELGLAEKNEFNKIGEVGLCEECKNREGIYQYDPYEADLNGVYEYKYLCGNCVQSLSDEL